MKNFINKAILLLLLCITSLSAQLEINQLIFNANDTASVQIFYEEIPDSIKINGELVSIENGQTLKLITGVYTIEAFKKCYLRTEKKVTLVSKRLKQITLEMNHLTSYDKTAYNISLYSNIIALPILNTFMITNKNYNDYILPIASTSIVQAYWLWKKSDKVEPCTEKNLKQNIKKKDFSINCGVSIQTAEYFNPDKREVSYSRSSRWNTFTHKYNQELDISLKSASFIPNLSLFIEMRKYFKSSKFFAELFVHSLLGSKVKFHVKESYLDDWHTDLARDYQAEVSRKYPVIVEASMNYDILTIIDQTFFISLGGYWGNPFIPKNNFVAPVQQAYLPSQVYEKPEDIKYSLPSYGFRIGITWETPLSELITHNFGYKWYSTSSKGFTLLSSGFKYALW